MSSLKELQRPIKEELREFEQHFGASMNSSVPLLNRITHYIVKRKGKQVRPMLVFLSAKSLGTIRTETHVAASLIELLHTASLIHDDVVDDAYKRRNVFSINAIWKNKIAVLVGDFFYARGFLLALKHEQYGMLQIISEAVSEMSEGELTQMDKARKLDITEAEYYDIIRRKTASMLAASCAAGAASVTKDAELITTMKAFGISAGMAYQIKDDLFDYGYANVGKPTGNDIKEKKLTLPLIYALKQTDNSERKQILKLIKNKSEKRSTRNVVFDLVKQHHGIEYAAEKMHHYRKEAHQILKKIPTSESQQSLANLIDFMTTRKT